MENYIILEREVIYSELKWNEKFYNINILMKLYIDENDVDSVDIFDSTLHENDVITFDGDTYFPYQEYIINLNSSIDNIREQGGFNDNEINYIINLKSMYREKIINEVI